MDIFIFSRSLNSLNKKELDTSSKIFELGMAKALSKYSNVVILSLGVETESYCNKISLIPVKNRKFFINEFLKKIKKSKINVQKYIIFFGYDLSVLINLIIISKIRNVKILSYTFDTHKIELKKYKIFKRRIIDIYFNLGIYFLNFIDGIILLNKSAYKELNLSLPFHISRVGIDENEIIRNAKTTGNKNFIIIYAGTLVDHNGINEILEAINGLENINYEFRIFGKGNLQGNVKDYSKRNQRIKYYGQIKKSQLDNHITQASLLLNIRKPEELISKFSFPSKLVEYMVSGVPVLTTKVINDKSFCDSVFIVENVNIREIRKKIRIAHSDASEREKRSLFAQEYVKENFEWSKIGKELIDFLEKIGD